MNRLPDDHRNLGINPMSDVVLRDDLDRVTLALYKDDIEFFRKKYGHGWTKTVRYLVHDHVRISRGEPPTEVSE